MRFYFELFMFHVLKTFILLMPMKVRFWIGGFLGELTYYLIKRRREITLLNIKNAFPEKEEKEIVNIAKKSYKIMGKNFLSILWNYKLKDNDKRVTVYNPEILEEAYKKGNGVLLATMHLGQFEASLRTVTKYNIYSVAAKQKNPHLDKIMNNIRRKMITDIIHKNKSAKMIIKAIKEKAIIVLFSDHYIEEIEVNFFGRKTMAASGIAALALKMNIPVVFGYTLFNDKENSCKVYYENFNIENTGDVKKDIVTNTQKLFYKFEEIIRKYPEQWMWQHRRWRDL